MRTRTRNLKRLLSLVLCLCMVTGLLPAAALAAGSGTEADPFDAGFILYANGQAVIGSPPTWQNNENDEFKLELNGVPAPRTDGTEGIYSITLYLKDSSGGSNLLQINTANAYSYDETAAAYQFTWSNGLRDPDNPSTQLMPDGTYDVWAIANVLGADGTFLREDYYNAGQVTVRSSTDTGALDMTVTRNGEAVTEFANTDTIIITANVSSGLANTPEVSSVFFGETWIYVGPNDVETSGTQVSITLHGLYKAVYDSGTDTVTQGALLSPGSGTITFYDDGNGSTKYTSNTTYTVTGEGGTGNSTCTAAFATDESFTNTVSTVQNNGTEYYVRLSNFSPAFSLPDPTNQPSQNYSVSISADAYTLWVTDTKVEYNTDGSTVAYIQKGPAAIADSNTSTALPTGSYTLEINIYNPNTSMTTPLCTYTSTNQMTVTAPAVSAPTIITGSLPDATVNRSYEAALSATAGSGGTLTWSVTSGSLPTGLSLSSTGAITGTPTAAGNFTFTVQVAEAAAGDTLTATKQFSLTVQALPGPTITTTSLPNGVTGVEYSQTLQATPVTEGKAITWSVTSGSLPTGLSLDSSTGAITGTPTAAGSYTFTVTAQEADGGEASKSFTIAVTQAITSTGLTVTGGSYSPGDRISVRWNMSSSLPSDAAATLTLHYTDTSNAEKSATCSMTRYSNYFYAYVALPGDCASVEKLSASATIGSQNVTGENTNPGITMKGKLRLTWDSLSTSGTLTIKDSSDKTVASRSLYSSNSDMELSLPEGTYTLSAVAYVSGLGKQTLLNDTTVTVNAGATTEQTLTFHVLEAVTYEPTVKLDGGNSTSSYSLYWYNDAGGTNLLATGKSYKALSTATLYVKAVPTGTLSATHNETSVTQVTSANMTLTLTAKSANIVTVTVQCEDVTGGGNELLTNVSGYVVLSQPGADGTKTTQQRVYNAGSVAFGGVTEGSTITFTPDQKYGCGPVSETIGSVTSDSRSITLTAEALEGVISSNITLHYPNRTMNLTFTSMSNLKVKKDDGTVIPHHRTSGNILVLDDLSGLRGGDTLTISGQFGAGDFPIAVFEKTVTLSNDGKLSATADITMVARGTAQIKAQNQSRVAADLLLYQGDKLFYTQETFIASHVSTYDYVYSNSWVPRLPAGSYTVYVVNRDYLRTVDPTTYQEISDIRFEEGTYSCADFTIRNNETTSVTLKVPDVAQAYADVNFEMSSVTMSVDFPGTFTHTTVITLTGDEQLDETRGITLYLYNGQSSSAAALQSLTINGIPYKNVLESRHDHVYLKFTGDELQRVYGGFPLRVSYVMSRYDYSKLEGRSFMTYTNDRGESRSVKVGAFYQETDDVTLNVPSMVNKKTFTVSGYVPQRGKDVTVYLDGAAVATVRSGRRADVSGKVISTTNGYFAAQVTLPEDAQEFDAFRVSAFCEGAMSEEAEVMYTKTSGLLTEVRFYPGRIGNLADEYTVWKLGDSPSEGQRYLVSNMSSWLRWELDFANADKVKNVVVHVPRSNGSEEEVPAVRMTASGYEHIFQTTGVLIYGASPTGVYVTYETELVPRANAKTAVTAADFTEGIAALNGSGVISDMMGNQDSLTFTLKNPDGKEGIPVTVESKTEDWGENESAIRAELASFDALKEKPEYSTLPSYILYYDEGYLDIYENDDREGGFWGSDRICKYETVENGTVSGTIYQREIYTMSERIVITWDVEAQTTTTHRITLGEGGAQPDEALVTGGTDAAKAYQRTAQVEQLWMLFYQQLSDACEKAGTDDTGNTRMLAMSSRAAPKGGKLSLKVKIDVNKLKERADALAEDSETWAEGQEITAAEIRQIKDFLDDNPGLVDLYKMHQSTGGDNPYQVVGDARATYYERGMGLIEKALSLATGKPKDVVDTLKDGIKDYAIDTVKGKIFYRQSEGMVCDLYVAARQAERTETGVGGLLPGGINWSRFPTNIYDPNSSFSAGNNRQTLPNSPSYTYDPSGYVYEAVPSNRVKGAEVNLYTFNESAKVEEWVDHELYNIEPNPQVTEADGRYEWFVPEGYWRVVVTKDGYESVDTGSSPNYGKKAKPVEGDPVSGRYWMPVLPIQLDVNIPLVSYAAPTVQKVEATTDGVYITFSKYMQVDLGTNDFLINGVAPAKVEALNAEAASSADDASEYASVFRLAYPAEENVGVNDTIQVYVNSTVASYAGTQMEEPYAGENVTVAEQLPQTEAPALAAGSSTAGTVDQNTVVYLTVPDGASVYYTIDGSDPADEANQNRKLYNAVNGIIVDQTMTIRAVAFMAGMSESSELTLKYTVEEETPGGGDEPGGPDQPGGGASDSSGEYLVNVGKTDGGKITVNPGWADEGDTVTLTVTPNSGYELSRLTVTDAQGNEMKLSTKDGVKYTFIMPDSRVTVKAAFSPIVTVPVNPFTDVSTGDYYYDAVLWAVANGVTSGASATTFAPNATVTRAQAMTFLWRAHGSPKATGSNPFTDVSASDYYYDAVLWAVANGVTSGTSATTFSPNAPVTRAQAMTFQWRAAGSPVVAGDSFDDVAADAYYAGAVTWAVANGITNGTGGNKFSPEVTVTRAQAVTFLWRELA